MCVCGVVCVLARIFMCENVFVRGGRVCARAYLCV